jgi:AhpD family alkylhydroperoxidase
MSSSHARIESPTFYSYVPGAREALSALEKVGSASGLEKELKELVKMRASQINGCAFCLQYHLNDAYKLGIAREKLDLLSVWREAGIYSPRECAALAWTETLTEISKAGVSDAAYAAVRKEFTEQEVAYLTVAIGTINFWNRVAVSMHFAPPIPKAKTGEHAA